MVQRRAGSGNVVPLMVRVPEDLRDRIKTAAEVNGRSQNSEIVATLEEAYPVPLSLMDKATLEWLAENIPRKKLDEVLADLIEWRRQNEVDDLLARVETLNGHND